MSVTFAKGFSAAGVAAGISSIEGKKDLALVVNQGPLDSAAGVFTFNRFCAAPVQWSRKTVADGHIKAVVLNSGGANACTGQAGYEQSAATAKKVADLVGTQPDEIAVCSTGLIGELLPLDHVLSGVESAYAALSDDDQAGSDASHAIMTTDTKSKTVSLEGDGYRIGGMVKGSGMIAPQLATMLCVITTDAAVGAGQLQAALNAAVDHSFNRIDVDGCMSTNDTVLLLRRVRRRARSGRVQRPGRQGMRIAGPADHRRRRGSEPRRAHHRHRRHHGERRPGLRPRGRGLEPAQMRHCGQRPELGTHRILAGHRAR